MHVENANEVLLFYKTTKLLELEINNIYQKQQMPKTFEWYSMQEHCLSAIRILLLYMCLFYFLWMYTSKLESTDIRMFRIAHLSCCLSANALRIITAHNLLRYERVRIKN